MAVDYQKNPEAYQFFELEDYISLVIEFLEKLSPEIVIERFAGEVPPRFLAGPGWGSLRYDQVLQKIEKTLLTQNSWQGKSLMDPQYAG